MGAQSSKLARKLPTKPRPETLRDVPQYSPSKLSPMSQTASGNGKLRVCEVNNVRFSETIVDYFFKDVKTEFIESDSSDPHLLNNLKALGPVVVPPTITKMRTSDTMLNIIKHRKQLEGAEIKDYKVTDDAISTDSLFSLFEQRKRLQPGEINRPEIRQSLMKKYKVDEETLNILLSHYNTIAVMPVIEGDKEERRPGVWVNDRLDWEQSVKEIEKQNLAMKKAREEAIKDHAQQNTHRKTGKEKKLESLFEED
ncbi:hypothetical protein BDF20DRAFT_937617 [Mycotypha africana]|uniref:uncharacterized protein n=1 Tax=Mycotypha africana TaxID=64632 RepID=UPI0022FFD0A6|nr:uncharacterized protein BDF20DRAFT_937617 [Mycotypha africana]KAI8982069.1 hypothetical protein BDF20DRAFT_937617 [Mycotypha africana]